MNSQERLRDELNKKLLDLYESDEFIEGSKKVNMQIEDLKQQIEKLDYEMLSPKQKLHFMLEKEIAGEEADED